MEVELDLHLAKDPYCFLVVFHSFYLYCKDIMVVYWWYDGITYMHVPSTSFQGYVYFISLFLYIFAFSCLPISMIGKQENNYPYLNLGLPTIFTPSGLNSCFGKLVWGSHCTRSFPYFLYATDLPTFQTPSSSHVYAFLNLSLLRPFIRIVS